MTSIERSSGRGTWSGRSSRMHGGAIVAWLIALGGWGLLWVSPLLSSLRAGNQPVDVAGASFLIFAPLVVGLVRFLYLQL